MYFNIEATSFSSIPYWSNSEHWSQKLTQSGNIHSILLDVYDGWQSAQNFPLKINCSTLLHLTVSLFGKQDWVKTEFQIEVLTLIQNITENRTRHARGPVQNISYVS